jgi:hypothetical protein
MAVAEAHARRAVVSAVRLLAERRFVKQECLRPSGGISAPASRSLGLDLVHLGRHDLVRALERGPHVVVRHAISYHFLATVRAPKSMWV